MKNHEYASCAHGSTFRRHNTNEYIVIVRNTLPEFLILCHMCGLPDSQDVYLQVDILVCCSYSMDSSHAEREAVKDHNRFIGFVHIND
jgi:hypothetical protein